MRELIDTVLDSTMATGAVKVVGLGGLAVNTFADDAFGVATDIVTFVGGIVATIAAVYLIRRHDTQRELDKLRIEEIYRRREAESEFPDDA